MESDYPYVLLNATWVGRDVLQFADEFGDYLLSDTAASMFTDAGFRARDNQPGAVLRSDDCLQAMDQVAADEPGDPPEVEAFRMLRSSWVVAPRFSRMLLLVDVSGSTAVTVPQTGRTRLDEMVDAATASVQIAPNRSNVGLWEFSTALPDGDGDGDYRRLVPIGPLNGEFDGRQRKAALRDELASLNPENDSALNDTLLAAYRQMRADYTVGLRHVIVLMTDGRNDDPDSISHAMLLDRLTRLHRSQEPIHVLVMAYGGQADADELAEITDRVGGRVVVSPEPKDLENLFIEALGR
jgi:hypothetical protein